MKQAHFIGIGGIGMSALAYFFIAKGWRVSGSDLVSSPITDNLKKEGVGIFIGNAAKNIDPEMDKVIYSSAVKGNDAEVREARFLKIPCRSYAEELGDLTRQYITVAVSGSHGKSTTTALLALMMIEGGLDPTVIVGTRLKEFGGKNFRLGKSRYLLIEADEWNNSFHNYHPALVVVTNIDKEHLDTFKDLKGVIVGFKNYLKNVAGQGRIFINAQDKNSLTASKECSAQVCYFNNSKFKMWPLKVPGDFNQLNAEAAWQAANYLGVSKKDALEAVKNYRGSWRRMEFLSPKSTVPASVKKAIFISDYAHHPTEISATGKGAREMFSDRPVVVIFQPHQIERLTNLFRGFAKCFGAFDAVGILPAYEVTGRELAGGKNSQDLATAVRGVYLPDFKKSFNLIKEFERPVVVFMGAGDIDIEVRKYFKSKLLPM